MANYKSIYTGAEIDSAIGKANTALQEHQPLKTINNESLVGDGNITIEGTSYEAGNNIQISEENVISATDTIYDDTELRGTIAGKQEELISGTNIKTINGNSILGEGNLVIEGGEGGLTSVAHDDTLTGAGTNASPLGINTTKIAQKSDIPDISGKQDTLVSGTNIKTINNQSILGDGNIVIEGGSGSSSAVSLPTQCLYGLPNYFEGKKILVSGDSITQGHGTTKRWFEYIKDYLGLSTVYNDGLSSAGIKRGSPGLFTRIDTWNSKYGTDFDAIILMENMNDIYQDVSLSSFSLGEFGDNTIDTQYGAVKLVIEKIQALYPLTPILWVISCPRIHYGRTSVNPVNPGWSKYGEFEPMVTAIKEVCENYAVPVLDLYHNSLIRPWLKPNYDKWIPDGVHPNAAGHEVLGRVIAQHFIANVPYVDGAHGLYTKRDITYNLTNVKVYNNMAYITNGSEFCCWVKPSEEGGTVGTVTVTMGGSNITSSAYNASTNAIKIPSVTGNVVITAEATASNPRYDITRNLTNVTLTNANTKVEQGSTYTAVVNPSEGYSVGMVTVEMGGTDITATAYNSINHQITIGNVTGDIIITASGEIRVLSITNNLIGTSNSNSLTSINYGQSYDAIITKNNQSSVMSNFTLYMDETNYTATNYNEVTGAIHFDRVVGNIVITAVAGAGYTITNNLTQVTTNNLQTGVEENASYTAVLSPEQGRDMGTVSVTMDGNDITSSAYTAQTKTISIVSVTGDIVITANSVAQTFTITNILSGVTNSNNNNSIVYGESYIATLAPENQDNQVVVDSITMNGSNVTYSVYNESTNTINIAAVNGNIIITAHQQENRPQDLTDEIEFVEGIIDSQGTPTSNWGSYNNSRSKDVIRLGNSPAVITLNNDQVIAKVVYYQSDGTTFINASSWYQNKQGVSAPFVTGDHIDIPANSVIRIALGNSPSKQGDHAAIIAEQVSNITFTGVLA